MRIRNKRRRHYVKHGWKKFIDSYIDFKYEFTYSDAKQVGDQLMMDVGIVEKGKGISAPLPVDGLEGGLQENESCYVRGREIYARNAVILVGTPAGSFKPLIPVSEEV